MLLYTPGRASIDPTLPRDQTYGWVIFSIPWKRRRFGLTITTDGWWFLGLFTRMSRGDR
jgi:hypothetical protein